MPGQALLKATLLKETYGPLIDSNGTERDHVVRVLPSHFSNKERMFLNLIAPNVFPVKELQHSPGLRRARFHNKDLVNVHEKPITDAKTCNLSTRVAPIDEEFELTNQLCDQVSTPKLCTPKSPSNASGIDRSARLSCSPAEALTSYRTAIFQEVMCELEERIQVPSCDDTERPSGIRSPTASQRVKRTQPKDFGPRSCSTDDENATTKPERELTPRTAVGAANRKQPSLKRIEMFDHIRFQTVSDERKHNTVIDAYDHKPLCVQSLQSGSTEGVKIETEPAISSGSYEVSDFDWQPSATSHGDSHRAIKLSSEMYGKNRLTEESTVMTLSWRCYSKSLASSGSTSCTLLMPSAESKTIDNPDGKVVDKIMATVTNLSVNTEGEKANFTRQLQAQKGAQETIEKENSTTRSFRQHMPLEQRNGRHSLIELTRGDSEEVRSRRSSKDDDDVQIVQATEGDAKGQLSSIMRSQEFQDIPDQNVRSERSRNTEASEQLFNKDTKSGADRTNVDDIRHFPSGWYEDFDSTENPSAKSHGDSHERCETLYEMFGENQSMKERTAFQSARQNFSSGWPEVSMSDQTSSAKSPGDSHKPLARPSERLRRSQTMKETTVRTPPKQELYEVSERFGKSQSTIDRTAVTAAWLNHLDSSPTATVSSGNRSWKLDMPTIASNTLQKLQKMLRKATRIQPVVDTEREKANSVTQAQDRKPVRSSLRDELLHDNSNSSSMSQVLHGNAGTRHSEIAYEEGQKLSPLLRMLKKILGRHKCKVRINVVGAWLDNVDWTTDFDNDGDKISSHPPSPLLPFETYKSPGQEREPRGNYDWLFAGSPPQRSSHQRESPKRTPPRSPWSSAMRLLSPKRNADYARDRKPHKFEVVSPRRSAFREYGIWDGIETASLVHLTGGRKERTIGVPRTAISNVEEADMDYSGAHDSTRVGEPCVSAEDRKSPELWRHPVVDNRQRPRSTCSRFRLEYIARQRNSRQLSPLQ